MLGMLALQSRMCETRRTNCYYSMREPAQAWGQASYKNVIFSFTVFTDETLAEAVPDGTCHILFPFAYVHRD